MYKRQELNNALQGATDRDDDTEALLNQVEDELKRRDPNQIDGWDSLNLRDMKTRLKEYGHDMSEDDIVDQMALAGNELPRIWQHSSAYNQAYEDWLTGHAATYAGEQDVDAAHAANVGRSGRDYIDEQLGKPLHSVTNAMHANSLPEEGKQLLRNIGFIPSEANFRRHLRGEQPIPYGEDSAREIATMGGTAKRRTRVQKAMDDADKEAMRGMTPTERREYKAQKARERGDRARAEIAAAQKQRKEERAAQEQAQAPAAETRTERPAATDKRTVTTEDGREIDMSAILSLIHISEPTRRS